MIQRYGPRVFLFAAIAGFAVAGCSSNSGNPVAPTLGTGGVVTPTPAPVHTPTPTPVQTADATPTPGGSISNINACAILVNGGTTVPVEPVPGTYSIIELLGNESAGSFSNVQSAWEAVDVTSSPAPSPSPTATPAPTPTPSGSTTVSYHVYLGSYSIPAFTVPAADSETASPGPVNATVGCAIIAETVDGSAIGTIDNGAFRLRGGIRSRNTTTDSYNTEAIGFPNIGNEGFFGLEGSQFAEVGEGNIPSVTLPLSSSGGTGSFTLDNGVVGSVTYGPPQVYTATESDDIAKLRGKLARATAILNGR